MRLFFYASTFCQLRFFLMLLIFLIESRSLSHAIPLGESRQFPSSDSFSEIETSVTDSSRFSDESSAQIRRRSDAQFLAPHSFSSHLGSSIDKVAGGSIERRSSQDSLDTSFPQIEEMKDADIEDENSTMDAMGGDKKNDTSVGDVLD